MPWLAALVCALAGAVVFQFFGNANRGYVDTASLFYWWGFQWVNAASETEHGWLVLGLSAWLLWRNLRIADRGLRIADWPAPGSATAELQPVIDAQSSTTARPISEVGNPQSAIRDPQSDWSAAVAIFAALALHALGFAAQQARVSILALLVFAWGVLRLGGGRRWGAAAVFPLGFLVFAIPINVLDSAGFWLRMWVIDASGWLAKTAGIAVMQSGTQLLAPDGRYNYDVAAACSGVRSLTALAALSLLMGYLSFRAWWRRGLLLLFCFPLVYLGNVARISAIIFAAQLGGQAWGERAHEVMGYGVFVIVLGGVFAAAGALRRWCPEEEKQGADDGGRRTDDGARRAEVGSEPAPRHTWAVAAGVVVFAAGEMVFLHHLANSPARGQVGVVLAADGTNPVELPAFIGSEWIGRREEVTAVEREILPPDTGFSRKTYVSLSDAKRRVLLSLVLSGRDRTSIHRPELCLVGQGWSIAGTAQHEFRYPGGPGAGTAAPVTLAAEGKFPATLLRVRREVPTARGKVIVPQLVAYWFVGGDTVVATHWQRIARDSWNRVAHARADRWAYVLMQTDAADGETAALARLQAILDSTLPAFQRKKS